MRLFSSLIIFTLCALPPAAEGSRQRMHGRVVNNSGAGVPDVDIATLWGANGLDREGRAKVSREKDTRALWEHEGRMEPQESPAVTTDDRGGFSIELGEDDYKILAIDRARKLGALVIIDPDHPDQTVEIRLQPMIRVHGTVRLAGQDRTQAWTYVEVSLSPDLRFPLGRNELVSCGSFVSRFEFLLPPGDYVFSANNDEKPFARTSPNRTVTLRPGDSDVDLGALEMTLSPTFSDLKEASKRNQTWHDYQKFYGQQPPPWHVIDTRGVPKDVRLSDFKGKWVILYFWGPFCRPCLKSGIPQLMEFQEREDAFRDKFQILAFCLDYRSEIKALADVDEEIKGVVKTFWKRPPPFPMLLDNSFRTYESFGLESLGTLLVVDPAGRLVAGDLMSVAKALHEQ